MEIESLFGGRPTKPIIICLVDDLTFMKTDSTKS